MTERSDPLVRLLERWPLRFRLPDLMERLAGDADPPEHAELARAALMGLARGLGERGAFEAIVKAGRFHVAEAVMLDASDTLKSQALASPAKLVESARAGRRQQLLQRLDELAGSAERAGLDLTYDRQALVALADRSWPDAERRLAELAQDLGERVEAKRSDLRKRIDAFGTADGDWAAACSALVENGQWQSVEQLLAHPEDRLSGPATVPRLPHWAGKESAETLLRWHLTAAGDALPAFQSWASQPGSPENELFLAYDRLREGGNESAAAFADALERFLGLEPGARTVHPVEGGYLTTLNGLFGEPGTEIFRPTGTVDLFVGEPERRTLPELQKLGPHVAVGPALGPEARAGRADCALITLDDLIGLGRLRSKRSAVLLRTVGEWWPLAAFTGGSPAELAERLGAPGERWARLSWIVDLTGLGDLALTAALAFETALEPALVHLYLEFLAESRMRTPSMDNVLRPQLAAAVASALLEPLAGSAAGEAAFWALLAAAPPGDPVNEEDLVLEMALACDDSELERFFPAGLAELSTVPLVERTGTSLQFRECGALILLAEQSDDLLTAALDRLSEAGEAAPDPMGTWREETNAALAADPHGVTDIGELVKRLAAEAASLNSKVMIEVEVGSGILVAASDLPLRATLRELLRNAFDALGEGGGTVRFAARTVRKDVIISVQDTGPGVDYPGSEHLIFRRGEGNRPAADGEGLYLARRLAGEFGGELLLASATDGHPVYVGAHFDLILPLADAE
ncbi:ATP-binding protein [Actinomadura mexicana]|uniref:histidine kinase n=1 Tax=Actinomadura mexicana TaxID=134959 RepID=A0A239BZM8_9ACTN|nr:ATP-binding protein [Actinomadura mexicana]SNS13092.1 hypothetical protein SAMN06265355_111186 [Actinomadura mexicana]